MGRHGPIGQIGLIVEDIDASIQGWIDRMGVGPWTLFRNVTLAGTCRGADTVVTMDVALGYQGETQIELIMPTNDQPSPYRDDGGALLLGLHHLAWVVDDLDAAVFDAAADGLRPVFAASSPGTRVAYLSGGVPGMPLFEFIESPSTRALIAAGIAGSREWNGENPVHVIDFAAV